MNFAINKNKNMVISIYEDNVKLRELIELLISTSNEHEVVGTYSSCDHIIQNIRQDQPDLIIMDIDMPAYDGIGGLQKVKAEKPNIKILMNTVFEDDEKLFKCLSLGADGYILKKDAPNMLFSSIKEVMEGGAPMSPGIALKVLKSFKKNELKKDSYNLTTREKEVLELLARGFSYRMIGIECAISVETVRRHLKNIYVKLHVQCGTEAVAKAIREHVIGE
jgi:DNA-binding NarL/FixJ family response regulator